MHVAFAGFNEISNILFEISKNNQRMMIADVCMIFQMNYTNISVHVSVCLYMCYSVCMCVCVEELEIIFFPIFISIHPFFFQIHNLLLTIYPGQNFFNSQHSFSHFIVSSLPLSLSFSLLLFLSVINSNHIDQ